MIYTKHAVLELVWDGVAFLFLNNILTSLVIIHPNQ